MQNTLGRMITEELICDHILKRNDIGEDACLKAKGFVFTTESYEVQGVGHLCIMGMSAMLGLMKMETVILSSFDKDMPLYNLDRVIVPGKITQIAELYNTQLAPYPQELLDEFRAIADSDADLEDYVSPGEHWYDRILYPCSYHKTGKRPVLRAVKGTDITARMDRTAANHIRTFARQLKTAKACDRELKRSNVGEFADELIRSGGPAVDQVTKLFGPETAGRLIRNHMYGVQPPAGSGIE